MRAGDLIDHYRLEHDLGAGAFATVWLATDSYLDDPVAIKVLADNWARDDDIRRRFIDEAKIMRRIDHPSIVRVFAVGELPTGQPMFVMTYAEGGTLGERIKDRRDQAHRFTPGEVVEVITELADCLSVVHDFGVVHRDLKPSNVLYRSRRRHEQTTSDDSLVMVLGDFGLAKDTIARSGFTFAAGTPAYMAPEQARTTSELDHRADIYSATAIMFELLAGVPPFDASTLSDVNDGRTERRPELDRHRPDLAPGWQGLIDIGMAHEPAHRFESARELAEAVAELVGDADVVRRRTSLRADRPERDVDAPTGLSGRVDELLARFATEHSPTIEQRLRTAPTVAAVGDESLLARLQALTETAGLHALRLPPTDVRLGDTDVVVMGSGVDGAQITETLADAPAGPVAVMAEGVELGRLLDIVGRRSDAIRATAALAQLDDDVRRAGSASMSESWMQIRERVETIRLEVPAFAELAVLRAEAAGRLVLPKQQRTVLRRLLLETDTSTRLGLADGADDQQQLDRVVVELDAWRQFQDSSRVPFTSRNAVETVVRCLERLWAGLSGYTPT